MAYKVCGIRDVDSLQCRQTQHSFHGAAHLVCVMMAVNQWVTWLTKCYDLFCSNQSSVEMDLYT